MLNNLFYISYIDDLDTRASLVNWDGGSTWNLCSTKLIRSRFGSQNQNHQLIFTLFPTHSKVLVLVLQLNASMLTPTSTYQTWTCSHYAGFSTSAST